MFSSSEIQTKQGSRNRTKENQNKRIHLKAKTYILSAVFELVIGLICFF